MPNHGSVDSEDTEHRTDFLYPFVKHEDMPWKAKIIPDYIIPFIQMKHHQGSKPTVRGVLYYLESRRIVPKNDYTYERLKRVMSEARRGYKRRDGTRGPPTIAMDAFADNTRQVMKDFNDEERSLEDYINDGIVHFRKLPNGFKTLVPRWLDQPNYVDVWVEKKSKATDVQKALNGRHVVIAPHGGNPSITFIHENIERVVDQFIEHNREKVYILYLGDLDPLGWHMDDLIREDLAKQTEDLKDNEGKPAGPRFVFKRIGITIKQIRKYNLTNLMHPDPETLDKLRSKGNLAERFEQEFGSLFQIELEAFDLVPFADFKKEIITEIDKLFENKIHTEVLSRPEYSQEPDEIKEQIVVALRDLIDELEQEGGT